MNAETLDLSDVFRKDARYVVPTFQRPYVWEEEDHWKVLWDDVRQVVEEYMEAEENGNEVDVELSRHFLGAIVLDQKRNKTGKLEEREIIDGQQRLITLQVMLASAHLIAEDRGYSCGSTLEKLMYNDEDLVDDKDDLLKLWPIESDRDAFTDVMLSTKEGDSINANHELVDCFNFFHDAIEEWLDEGPSEPENRLSDFVDAIWGLIHFVVIDLESNDDAQVIFETLNARGTPLLAADLIKNYLFREANKGVKSPAELHDTYWRQFDGDVWREEVSQGRLDRPRIDVFIMHWLTMRTSRQIRATKLFQEFRRYLEQTNREVEEMLQDIDHHSSVYLQFSEPHESSREGLFFERLDVLDTTTPMPVLLWMYGNADVPVNQRVKAVACMESWLVRRMLCRLTSKNYNNIFLELLEELKGGDPEDVGDNVVEFFRNKEGDSDYWPDDTELEQAMVEKPYWSRINQRRLKMVFTAIERNLRDTGFSETLDVTENLQIEHILPQEWAHNWELPGEKPEEVERMERNQAKDLVGNLTVLTDKLNPAISNAGWRKKREEISDHTVLKLNRYLVEEWQHQWNEDTIAERGSWLAQQAAEVWPSPESSYWNETDFDIEVDAPSY